MGISKTDLFTKEQNELASLAKVLSNPARIAILQHLIRANACINNDLVGELGLAQATISQHLKELKLAGLIQGTIEGTSMSYCIDRNKWLDVQQKFSALFDKLPGECEDTCC